MPTLADHLKGVHIFAELTDGQRQKLAQACRKRVYHERVHIFHEGDAGSLLYLVLRGGVRVYVRPENAEQDTTLAVLTTGEFFGEMALLLGEPRSASVVTIAPATEMLLLDQASFEAVLSESFELTRSLLRNLALRLQATNQHLIDIAAHSSLARLAKLLLARADDRCGTLAPALSQEEIAGLIGVRRETVARNLAKLEEAQALKRNRGQIEIINLRKLHQLSRTG